MTIFPVISSCYYCCQVVLYNTLISCSFILNKLQTGVKGPVFGKPIVDNIVVLPTFTKFRLLSHSESEIKVTFLVKRIFGSSSKLRTMKLKQN